MKNNLVKSFGNAMLFVIMVLVITCLSVMVIYFISTSFNVEGIGTMTTIGIIIALIIVFLDAKKFHFLDKALNNFFLYKERSKK